MPIRGWQNPTSMISKKKKRHSFIYLSNPQGPDVFFSPFHINFVSIEKKEKKFKKIKTSKKKKHTKE